MLSIAMPRPYTKYFTDILLKSASTVSLLDN